jgi:hypothetical protein
MSARYIAPGPVLTASSAVRNDFGHSIGITELPEFGRSCDVDGGQEHCASQLSANFRSPFCLHWQETDELRRLLLAAAGARSSVSIL